MSGLESLGRGLLFAGLALVVVGVVVLVLARLGLPRLPGDFTFQRGGVTVFIPLATSLLLSLVLTLLLNLLARR